ncbi:unnamed protein product [Ceutorhynchus assimilis]|uniref:Alpha-mannosidase n=1 Tax=Ceutorhynchus assimilis TaxID=467358 RepID=A0A9N9MC26_9CUCU|nr:unnamed protein product [Ceutorhynchus assimilis]
MRTRFSLQLLALIVTLVQCKSNCGYQSCHPIKDGYINVHLIPHSHDDVGWVKTVDQFYYGTNNFDYRASVQTIYDNVLKAVQKNKQRRFIYVESAFFWKWWQEQNESERNQLQQLVNSGQIEFAGGGWSMNDEAVVNYQSVIDQMSWGLKKLNDSFGDCGRPKAGWQIDPFGHSNEMASIFAGLGYDGVILGRIDYEDKSIRLENRSMEMVWRGSRSLGRQTDIFTTTLYNHYDAPAGFCFDILCEDSNLVDDPYSPEYNIDVKAEEFISEHIKDSIKSFQTNNVIVPMGRDFAYQEAETWFRNIDKLIKYINNHETFEGKKYNLLYSTPSCYIAAVQKQSKGILTSPLKLDDFFPYATDPHAYWTGYYTSRPTLKRYERLGNNFLQVCKQLFALAHLPSEFEPRLDSLREAMGVMQHHDAITGTEKETVAYDYARLLHIGINDCENVTSEALSYFTNIEANDFNTCLLTNISQCALTETHDKFVVTVYNPLSRLVSKYVRLPVNGNSFSITGPDGNNVHSQILPTPIGIMNIPSGRQTSASLELIFEAQDIPPLGFKSFYVQKKNGDDVTREDLSLDFSYFNGKGVGFTIDPSTGLVDSLEMNNVLLELEQKFWFYNGSDSFMDFSSKPSGAYVFRPDTLSPIKKVSDTAAFEVYRGDLVTEVRQTFSEYVSQTVRIYANEKFVEFDWVIGPIKTEMNWPSNGKEVISRFTTSLNSESTFYTDSNGRELMKRQRNQRPSWNVTVLENESSNYYPVTSKILIRDEEANLEFAVLTDRAEGGSSLADGEIELMLLRSCVTDDQFGVNEALMEVAYDLPIVARGSHYVTLGNIESEPTIASIENEIATQKLLDSWIFLSVPTETTFADYEKAHPMQFSGLKKSLPQNVHIMTLEPWTKSSYLLRLEHVFEIEQDSTLSEPVTVDLKQDLFTSFELKSIRETTLGANQWLKDNKRLNFKSAFQSDEEDLSKTKRSNALNNEFSVELKPMEIRTFIVEVVSKL